MIALWTDDTGRIFVCLAIAIVLATAIGLERQLRQKSAGLRTHALVGMGAALFMVVSKYGFDDVLRAGLVVVDPSRMAAQIVSGIGFIGAGLVFVRRNRVRGLTTAASIWIVAAVGCAAGAGLVLPAVFVTVAHFAIAYGYPFLARRGVLSGAREHVMRVRYTDGTGALRRILSVCTEQGLAVQGFTTQQVAPAPRRLLVAADGGEANEEAEGERTTAPAIEAELELDGPVTRPELIRRLSEIESVDSVTIDDPND